MPTTDLQSTTEFVTEIATEEATLAEEETTLAEEETEAVTEEETAEETEAQTASEAETFAETTAEAKGVWGGGSDMSLPDALSISAVGFGIVFVVLGFLAIFVFAMGKVFESLNKKASKKEPEKKEPAEASAKSEGYPLPDNQSTGDLTLINTTEEEAAVMESKQTEILNELNILR